MRSPSLCQQNPDGSKKNLEWQSGPQAQAGFSGLSGFFPSERECVVLKNHSRPLLRIKSSVLKNEPERAIFDGSLKPQIVPEIK
jgi:hypothetical protein